MDWIPKEMTVLENLTDPEQCEYRAYHDVWPKPSKDPHKWRLAGKDIWKNGPYRIIKSEDGGHSTSIVINRQLFKINEGHPTIRSACANAAKYVKLHNKPILEAREREESENQEKKGNETE